MVSTMNPKRIMELGMNKIKFLKKSLKCERNEKDVVALVGAKEGFRDVVAK
jgi:hypothetical protein